MKGQKRMLMRGTGTTCATPMGALSKSHHHHHHLLVNANWAGQQSHTWAGQQSHTLKLILLKCTCIRKILIWTFVWTFVFRWVVYLPAGHAIVHATAHLLANGPTGLHIDVCAALSWRKWTNPTTFACGQAGLRIPFFIK